MLQADKKYKKNMGLEWVTSADELVSCKAIEKYKKSGFENKM
jgi:hypothetical protein